MPIGLKRFAALLFSAAMMLACWSGCQRAPVVQVALDPAKVKSIALSRVPGEPKPTEVVDPSVILRCVNELNQLSYVSSQLEYGNDGPCLLLRGEADQLDVSYTFCFDFIRVQLPGKQAFYIKSQAAPIVGRMFGYMYCMEARDSLQVYAGMAYWDEAAAIGVKHDMKRLSYCYPTTLVPSSPGQLGDWLKGLPEPDIRSLDSFKNGLAEGLGLPD